MSSSTHHEGAGDVLVDVRGISKVFRTYRSPADRLKQYLARGMGLGGRSRFDEFCALQDVSFEVRRGDAVGLIGRNGSGKSTLLQIIAGVMRPTAGTVQTRGRVAALLELGSGFNPEFTGRENLALHATLVGIDRDELKECLPAIEAFADIGEFIDRPLKTYSSGMIVRLAFAVHAQLRPDVLIVDEALAVGDAAFQIKCMTHLRRLLDRGVCVLLVTHDPNTVRSFCSRAIWLDHGRIRESGDPRSVTVNYCRVLYSGEMSDAAGSAVPPAAPVESIATTQSLAEARAGEPGHALSSEASRAPSLSDRDGLTRWGSGEIVLLAAGLFRVATGEQLGVVPLGERVRLVLRVAMRSPVRPSRWGLGFAIRDSKGLAVVSHVTLATHTELPQLGVGQELIAAFEFDNHLAPGTYSLAAVAEQMIGAERLYFDFVENAVIFQSLSPFAGFSLTLPPVVQEFLVVESSRSSDAAEPASGGQ